MADRQIKWIIKCQGCGFKQSFSTQGAVRDYMGIHEDCHRPNAQTQSGVR